MNRRNVLEATLLGTAVAASSAANPPAAQSTARSPFVTANDGTKLLVRLSGRSRSRWLAERPDIFRNIGVLL